MEKVRYFIVFVLKLDFSWYN